MRKPPVRHTQAQAKALRAWLRANHASLVSQRIRQPRAAELASLALGFPVTRSHISSASIKAHLYWPMGGRAQHPVREIPLLTVANRAARTPRGKRLTHATLESLRYIANHLLTYATELEHIANTGRATQEPLP